MTALNWLAESADAEVDTYELAEEAADALEAYQRAPWRQLSESVRLEKLRSAIELLQRVERVETARTRNYSWLA